MIMNASKQNFIFKYLFLLLNANSRAVKFISNEIESSLIICYCCYFRIILYFKRIFYNENF